jgi:hypothetical protein
MRHRIIIGSVFVGAVIFSWLGIAPAAPNPTNGGTATTKLSRGDLTVYAFGPQKRTAKAIVLFASGNCGWGGLENSIASSLATDGYDVIGIDSEAYAATDYNLSILQKDFSKLAEDAQSPFAKHPLPLIIGGYGTGGAQAIAICGGPNPPHGIVGLLLIDPVDRGRFGLREPDMLNVPPTGPGTFSIKDFSKNLHDLRVVQWHAEKDAFDSRHWLDSVTVEHKKFEFPNDGREYFDNRDGFMSKLVNSVSWILD